MANIGTDNQQGEQQNIKVIVCMGKTVDLSLCNECAINSATDLQQIRDFDSAKLTLR